MHDDSTTAELDALLQLAGLTVNDEERRRLTILYGRLARDRDRLRQVVLGETEPAVTLVSTIEMGPR